MLYFPKTADDLPDGKVVGCLFVGNVFAAKLHHLQIKRQQVCPTTMGNKNAYVGGEPGEAVFPEPLLLDFIKEFNDLCQRIGGQGALHKEN